jgi:hypothetical protein
MGDIMESIDSYKRLKDINSILISLNKLSDKEVEIAASMMRAVAEQYNATIHQLYLVKK